LLPDVRFLLEALELNQLSELVMLTLRGGQYSHPLVVFKKRAIVKLGCCRKRAAVGDDNPFLRVTSSREKKRQLYHAWACIDAKTQMTLLSIPGLGYLKCARFDRTRERERERKTTAER
jgi:hypothetical protein